MRRHLQSALPKLVVTGFGFHFHREYNFCSGSETYGKPNWKSQPSFGATTNLKKSVLSRDAEKEVAVTLDSLVLVGGSSHPQLASEISALIGVPVANSTMARFADGEASIQIHDDLFEKDVFIIQPCAAPVNDSIMELLLTVSCARRAGARRVVAVIPYYGYKHHRRGSPISTIHNSRYLTSGAVDFAKMLQEMGVDRVIAVDLQRPGQGQEACFFDNQVPLESVVTTDYLVNYFLNNIQLSSPIVVVAPNPECIKKARKFQLGFQGAYGSDVGLAVFIPSESGTGPADISKLSLLGNPKLEGADIVIVDDLVDTAGTMSMLSERLSAAGAKNIYVCASYGLFSNSNSMDLIQSSVVKKVIVNNTLPLPPGLVSSKIEQVSIAPMLAHVILAEHFRDIFQSGDDDFEQDE